MRYETAFHFLSAACLLVLAFNGWMVERRLRRHIELIARLTRRVWVLEGSPPCSCCSGSDEEERKGDIS